MDWAYLALFCYGFSAGMFVASMINMSLWKRNR